MLKGGMTRDQVDEFFFGQFDDVATKVTKAVTLSDLSKTTAAGVVALSASLQRLIDLMMAFELCGDAELQKQVSWRFAAAVAQARRQAW